MNPSKITARAIEAVTLLLAAFNGFLTNSAPPTQQFSSWSFEVGLISVASLVILLIVIALAPKLQSQHNKWYLVSIPLLIAGVVVGIIYKSKLNEYVIEFPEKSSQYYIIGDEMTPAAQQYIKAFPSKPLNILIEDFGGIKQREDIWPRASINAVQVSLTVYYIAFVLLLVTSIFILAEGRLAGTEIKESK
jgi:hypothetical protein